MFIHSINEFRRRYHDLSQEDAVIGLMPLKPGEEIKLMDLAQRGVGFFPSVLAQLLSRSKTAQAEVLASFMISGTFVAYGQADLAARLPAYAGLGKVIAKRDKAHLGLGISSWPSLEVLYSLASLQELTYPLVVQPLLEDVRDLRVVVLGDHLEAYERINLRGFRKNLYQGGSSRPATLTPEQQAFCREVMARSKFSYAILDLLLDARGRPFLSEIGLKGGLTGARLSQAEFGQRVEILEQEFCRQWEGLSKTPP